MSNRFRDLEKPSPERRKDVVLMAAVSGLESLRRPGQQDFIQFSALFPNLFEGASQEARRTASAALSRLETIPDAIAEMIVNQPIDVAAPFISHYENLSEAVLARAIARHGVGHARAAARRPNLSPEGLAALWALNEPDVDRVLQLRGLCVEAAFAVPIEVPQAAEATVDEPAPLAAFPVPPLADVHGTDAATDELRDQLRGMILRGKPAAAGARETGKDKDVRDGVHRVAELLAATRDFDFAPGPAVMEMSVHLERLARFAASGDAHWFATALADALNASFSLAERIMLDLSGGQLATTMIALGSDESVIVTAVETYFPHMSDTGATVSKAAELVAGLDLDSCRARLEAWLRADAYTNRRPLHVPVLAETRKGRGNAAADRRGKPDHAANSDAHTRTRTRKLA